LGASKNSPPIAFQKAWHPVPHMKEHKYCSLRQKNVIWRENLDPTKNNNKVMNSAKAS
jgi:hypothetical protein